MTSDDIPIYKYAIELCNVFEVKREILCVPGSSYDLMKHDGYLGRRRVWLDVVECKAAQAFRTYYLPSMKLVNLSETMDKIIAAVFSIGMRMLTWAEYNQGLFGLTREYLFDVLNISHFTEEGIVDVEAAARTLLRGNLSTAQKYRLACLHCFSDDIDVLFCSLTEEEQSEFLAKSGYDLVSFWTTYKFGDLENLCKEQTVSQYRLERAVESGCLSAVKFCLYKTKVKTRKNALVKAALIATTFIYFTENVIEIHDSDNAKLFQMRSSSDWIVFRFQRFDGKENWVPKDYYLDIIRLLLMNMNKAQRKTFFIEDLLGNSYGKSPSERHTRILKHFLHWPYQRYALKIAKAIQKIMSNNDFLQNLFYIYQKMTSDCQSLKYREEKNYDYIGMFLQFWIQSEPTHREFMLKARKLKLNGLLIRTRYIQQIIMRLSQFIHTNWEVVKAIGVIVNSASRKYRKPIKSHELEIICVRFIKNGEWGTLDKFMESTIYNVKEASAFREALINSRRVREFCVQCIIYELDERLDEFYDWAFKDEESVREHRMRCLISSEGRFSIMYELLTRGNIGRVNSFVECIGDRYDVIEYKRDLIFNDETITLIGTMMRTGKYNMLDYVINWCLLSEDKPHLKQYFFSHHGIQLLEEFISDSKAGYRIDQNSRIRIPSLKFMGGRWEDVERLMTWCFTEEEIAEFKRSVYSEEEQKINKESFIGIHLALMGSCRFGDAQDLLNWLGLSQEGKIEFKKQTLLSYLGMEEVNDILFNKIEVVFRQVPIDKWRLLDMYFSWCLPDVQAILKFRNQFDVAHGFTFYSSNSNVYLRSDEIENMKKLYEIMDSYITAVHRGRRIREPRRSPRRENP